MRIDKFLKNSRIIKRRTIAKIACDSGRVQINDKDAKAGTDVQIGDRVSVEFGDKVIRFEVLDIKDNAHKAGAEEMYKILSWLWKKEI